MQSGTGTHLLSTILHFVFASHASAFAVSAAQSNSLSASHPAPIFGPSNGLMVGVPVGAGVGGLTVGAGVGLSVASTHSPASPSHSHTRPAFLASFGQFFSPFFPFPNSKHLFGATVGDTVGSSVGGVGVGWFVGIGVGGSVAPSVFM